MIITTNDLIRILIIAVLYLCILPFQLVIFPSTYYSVRDVIYSKNMKNAVGASASRFLFIFCVCLLFSKLGFAKWIILSGIGVGSFLCSWPSIYHYQLFRFFDHALKLLYFFSCIFSIAFSIACAWFSLDTVIPMIFFNKSFFLLENTGVSFLSQIAGLCIPVGFRDILERHEYTNPYMDEATFSADLCMTYRKMIFEQHFVDEYFHEIADAAEKYHIDYKLLETIILLERINRKTWYRQKIEYLACRFIPSYVIKRNCTLGLAQISVNTASEFFAKSPRRYLLDMLKDEVSIELCAYHLNRLLERYNRRWFSRHDIGGEYNTGDLNATDQLSLYIASNYVCGCNVSLRKFTLVYMTIISQSDPLNSMSNKTQYKSFG